MNGVTAIDSLSKANHIPQRTALHRALRTRSVAGIDHRGNFRRDH